MVMRREATLRGPKNRLSSIGELRKKPKAAGLEYRSLRIEPCERATLFAISGNVAIIPNEGALIQNNAIVTIAPRIDVAV